MNWQPARADHAIDRAAAIITFQKPLDPDTFDDAIIRVRQVAKAHQMNSRIEVTEPIEIPAGAQTVFTMDLTQQQPPRRVVFRRLDVGGIAVEELSISNQRLIFATLRYSRWQDFYRILSDAMVEIKDTVELDQNIKSVQLEFIDRFNSTKQPANHFEVINKSSPYICKSVSDRDNSLHNHAGWFEFEGETTRKLTNVNIDVVAPDNTQNTPPQTQITFLTMGRYDALLGSLSQPRERIDALHIYLKKAFRSLITKEAADRVALTID